MVMLNRIEKACKVAEDLNWIIGEADPLGDTWDENIFEAIKELQKRIHWAEEDLEVLTKELKKF